MLLFYIFLILANVLSLFNLNSMPEPFQIDFDQEDKSCQLIKDLKAEDSQKKYDEVVISLRKNDLTICDCMRTISQQKQHKKLNAIIKEHSLTDEDVGMLFAQKYLSTKELSFDFEKDNKKPIDCNACFLLSENMRNVLTKHLQNPHNITSIDFDLEDPNVAGRTELYGAADKNGLIHTSHSKLHLNKAFLSGGDALLDAFDQTVAHEIIHAQSRHGALSRKIGNIIGEDKKDSRSFKKLLNAHEKEADRVGQACSDIETVYNILRSVKSLINNQEGIDSHNSKNKYHASIPEEYEWAKKIKRLRKTEEHFNQQQRRFNSK